MIGHEAAAARCLVDRTVELVTVTASLLPLHYGLVFCGMNSSIIINGIIAQRNLDRSLYIFPDRRRPRHRRHLSG
jgi:hypothetical protein